MKDKINFNKLIKCQINASLFAIGGPPKDITLLSWSLYNHGVLFPEELYYDPLDLGNPKKFQYILIDENLFYEGRLRAYFDLSAKESKEIANKEWNEIKDERFLNQNDEIIVTPYHLASYQNDDLTKENLLN